METQESLREKAIRVEAEAGVPLSKIDETLLVKFAEDVAAQAARLDDLAKQLIPLCIAVPGIYAAVLKLVVGDQAVVPRTDLTLLAFLAWLLALGLSIAALLPERQAVDPDSLTEIRNYFSESAGRKYLILCFACLCSFSGIVLAVLSIFLF